MENGNIDVCNLERVFLQTDANYKAQLRIIDQLLDENLHLRQVIEMLITSKSPTI